jgi:SAM-dependent methyltransferase
MPSWLVADIGAGTGISSKMFLDAGYRVTRWNRTRRCVRREHWLETYRRSAPSTAPPTRPDCRCASVDLVTVAQAFHWFDEQATRREFARILRPRGLAAIWWNSRRLTGTPFLEGYEALLQAYGTDYVSVAERYADDARMRVWFGAGLSRQCEFRALPAPGLRGAARPADVVVLRAEGGPSEACADAACAARAVRCLRGGGTISFDYDTRIYAGHLT